jgi:hypothetical protein
MTSSMRYPVLSKEFPQHERTGAFPFDTIRAHSLLAFESGQRIPAPVFLTYLMR